VLDLLFANATYKGYRYSNDKGQNADYFIVDAIKRDDIDALKVFLKYGQEPTYYEDGQSIVMEACKLSSENRQIFCKLILDAMTDKKKYISVYRELNYCISQKLSNCFDLIYEYIKTTYYHHPNILVEIPFDIFSRI